MAKRKTAGTKFEKFGLDYLEGFTKFFGAFVILQIIFSLIISILSGQIIVQNTFDDRIIFRGCLLIGFVYAILWRHA